MCTEINIFPEHHEAKKKKKIEIIKAKILQMQENNQYHFSKVVDF